MSKKKWYRSMHCLSQVRIPSVAQQRPTDSTVIVASRRGSVHAEREKQGRMQIYQCFVESAFGSMNGRRTAWSGAVLCGV